MKLAKFPLKVWLLLIFMAIIKIAVATSINLGNDEVYYWTYALKLQWNYFDHPPLVAWLIRASTLNLSQHYELTVRLGAIISSSICTLIIFRIGTLLNNQRVGWYATLLYSSSFYCSIIAGTFILPDSPQMVFWLWAVYLLLKINRSIAAGEKNLRDWCWFGMMVGLALLCKVHSVFLLLAMALLILFKHPRLIGYIGIYIAVSIACIFFLPVLLWNFHHGFITYSYHSERVNIFHTGINVLSFLREISGEIFYNNPINFALVWVAVLSPGYNQNRLQQQEKQILLFCAIPLMLTLIVLSLFRDTLPHWSGPAYASLIPLAALKLEQWSKARIRLWIGISAGCFFIVITTGLLVINYYPGIFSANKDNLSFGKGDPTLDLYGWKETGKIIDSVYQNENQAGKKRIKTIIITKWFPAAHLDFYVCHGTALETYGMGDTRDLHQYVFSNQDKHKPRYGEDAAYILPSNLFDEAVLEKIKKGYAHCYPPIAVPIYRNGAICKYILIFRLENYQGKL
ncbi:glycosyltransferase family 39 protein [Pedobacter sp. HDW13]|uniref:ArnT family glycosyltransferase n=1 Tax=Pedobacter sp. HDW13 TaxID=2714940 RepID=UPI00140E0842|nr:glycosyltransferase family 39 protein [Pedobacter sp. HDW13]QIL41331.1 glycosyltransferase family 39 protein [Pedobacter sp. HDW13]